MLQKLLTKLQQKYSSCPWFKEEGFLAPSSEAKRQQTVKLPLFRLMFSPFNQILDNGKIFFLLTIPAAICLSIFSTILGFNYLCVYIPAGTEQMFCSASLWGYVLHSLIKILIWGFVGLKWYEYVYAKKQLTRKSFFGADKRYISFAGWILLFLFMNMLPMFSWWLLYMRNPNPDWRVELVFFAIVSIGFIMPIILLRFYTILSFVERGEKIPSFSYIWHKTAGNTLKIFLSFVLILILGMFVFGNLYSNFRSLSQDVSLYNMAMAEFIYNFFSLFIYLSILNNINLQYELLYPQEEKKDHAGN